MQQIGLLGEFRFNEIAQNDTVFTSEEVVTDIINGMVTTFNLQFTSSNSFR